MSCVKCVGCRTLLGQQLSLCVDCHKQRVFETTIPFPRQPDLSTCIHRMPPKQVIRLPVPSCWCYLSEHRSDEIHISRFLDTRGRAAIVTAAKSVVPVVMHVHLAGSRTRTCQEALSDSLLMLAPNLPFQLRVPSGISNSTPLFAPQRHAAAFRRSF